MMKLNMGLDKVTLFSFIYNSQYLHNSLIYKAIYFYWAIYIHIHGSKTGAIKVNVPEDTTISPETSHHIRPALLPETRKPTTTT